MNALLRDGDGTRLYEQYCDNERVWQILLERCRLAPGSTQFKPDRAVVVQLGLTYLCLNISTSNIERGFSKLSLIESKHRARHLGLWKLRDAMKLAISLPHQLNLYLSPVSKKTMDYYTLRDLVCPQCLIGEAQAAFVTLFGSIRKKGSSENLGPRKQAHIEAMENSCRSSRRSSNKLVETKFRKMSKPERRRQWLNSADAFVQKMRDTGRGPEETIFGQGVVNPGVGLGRTRLQKQMFIKLKKHAKKSRDGATKAEKCQGLARSIQPFRGGKKNSSNTILRLGQRAQAMIKAKAAYKCAGNKRDAEYSKAQHRAEKTHYDDAKVTAAPFMVTPKRSKKNEGVSSSSINKLPPWAALGPSLSKKLVPSPARSASTPPAPSSSPHAIMLTNVCQLFDERLIHVCV